jgi:methionyl-tRNA formyltransferase
VKQAAAEHGLPVWQPAQLLEPAFLELLKNLGADLFVVIAYGKILPEELLAVPRLFSVNVHASLLPRYRGAAPINRAIMNGEKETGVSVIRLNPRMDAGDILSQEPVAIEERDTAVTLRARLAVSGAELLCRTIVAVKSGNYSLTPQDEARVTFAPKLTKTLGRIDWQSPAEKIHNYVRGLQPWPSTYTFYRESRLKILDTVVADAAAAPPGTVISAGAEGFVVAAGDKGLLVKSVQPASGKVMAAASFIAGHALATGYRFP